MGRKRKIICVSDGSQRVVIVLLHAAAAAKSASLLSRTVALFALLNCDIPISLSLSLSLSHI